MIDIVDSFLHSGEFNEELLLLIMAYFFVLVICVPFHAFVQAFVAGLLGDKTAKSRGFLTMDPRVHLTGQSVLVFLLFTFTWSTRVPTGFTTERPHPKLRTTLTLLSGTISYLLLSALFLFGAVFFKDSQPGISLFLTTAGSTTISLFIINLLPIPFFDMGYVLINHLPPKSYYKLPAFLRRHEGIVSILFFLFGMWVLSLVIAIPSTLLLYSLSSFFQRLLG